MDITKTEIYKKFTQVRRTYEPSDHSTLSPYEAVQCADIAIKYCEEHKTLEEQKNAQAKHFLVRNRIDLPDLLQRYSDMQNQDLLHFIQSFKEAVEMEDIIITSNADGEYSESLGSLLYQKAEQLLKSE